MREYRRVLAVVDFTETGATVARRAHKLARLDQAELALLHLIEPDSALDGGYPPPSPSAIRRSYEEAALRRLAFFNASLGMDADDVALWARYGQPARAFADCVSAWHPDLVVAGNDPGYLSGAHDLFILGRASRGGGIAKRILGHFLSPVRALRGV